MDSGFGNEESSKGKSLGRVIDEIKLKDAIEKFGKMRGQE